MTNLSRLAQLIRLPRAICLLFPLGLVPVHAEVSLPAIFGDHMVLQQDTQLPVWGTAAPGETIDVTIADRRGRAVAGADGKWSVRLDPLAVTGTPVELKVSGKTNTLTFTDVLVGDVWLASGQSNMEFGIGNTVNSKATAAQFNYPSIRMFLVAHNLAFEPATDVKRELKRGQWVVCTPRSVFEVTGWNGFSAVALFFARDIYEQRKQPIGLIGAYWGGTTVEAWTSLDALKLDPAHDHFVKEFARLKDNFTDMVRKYDEEDLPRWKRDHDAWKAAKSQPPEPGIKAPKEPAKPVKPGEYPQYPAVLFNGMINPVIPYALKGVVWYQGESNGGKNGEGRLYAKTFATMINDWRRRWGQGDFPFLFVQCSSWEWGYFSIAVRDSQLATLAQPKTAMVVTMDIGDEKDVHPKDKLNVGRRLALAARHVAYGEDLVYSGPIYSSFARDGDRIRVRFNHLGSGLVIGSAPAAKPGDQPMPPASELHGFEISNSPNVYSPAKARIEGDSVIVWSESVPNPKHVRYAWAGYPKPMANLYNKEGLPASPFNTASSVAGAGAAGQ